MADLYHEVGIDYLYDVSKLERTTRSPISAPSPLVVRVSHYQTLTFEYEVADADLTRRLACSDRHALVFGFNATLGSSGYESKLRSLVAQASTNPSVAVDRVRGRDYFDVSQPGKNVFFCEIPPQ